MAMTKYIIFPISIILILVFFNSSIAQDEFTGDLDKLENIPYHENLVLEDMVTNKGYYKSHRIDQDKTCWTFSYHFNPEIDDIQAIRTLEIGLSRKFNPLWVDLFLSRTSATFRNLGEENPNMEGEPDQLAGTREELMFFGAGLSYRFSWIQQILEKFINSSDIFETTHAQLGYVQFTEKYYNSKYKGPGLKTDFSVHKRFSKTFHIGIKMSYNLASVKRKPITSATTTETSAERSLLLSWQTFAFVLGFYL